MTADTDQPTLAVTQADAARLFLAGFVTDDHAANKLRDGVHRMISTRLAIRAMVAFADARTTHEPRPAGDLREAGRMAQRGADNVFHELNRDPNWRPTRADYTTLGHLLHNIAGTAGNRALATHSPAPMAGEDVEAAAISLIVDLCGAGASQSATNVRVVEDHLRQFVRQIAARPSTQEGVK